MGMLELYQEAIEVLLGNSTPDGWKFRKEGNSEILAYNRDDIVKGFNKEQMIATCERIIAVLERIDNGRS